VKIPVFKESEPQLRQLGTLVQLKTLLVFLRVPKSSIMTVACSTQKSKSVKTRLSTSKMLQLPSFV
jgi:hypothetical protein